MIIQDRRWQYLVRLTYNDTVKWPKVPGELAIEVGCADESTMKFEVEASKTRTDVNIEVIKLWD